MSHKPDGIAWLASSSRQESFRLILAILLPFLAWGLQSLLWDVVQPFIWFFFYPAVFASSWLGGRAGGLIATVTSILLVNYFFMEPVHSFGLHTVNQHLALLMFALMGTIFAFTLQSIQSGIAKRLATEARFRTLFEQTPLGIAVIDSQNGHLSEINPRFAEIAGRTQEALVNTDWRAITHPDDIQAALDNMARLNAGEITGFQMDQRYLKPDGTVVWIHMTITPVNAAPGQSPHRLCIIEDITERRAADQRQALILERMKLANDVADIGIWDWDLQTNQLEWDGRLCHWYGVTPAQRQTGLVYERWRAAVHPDDVAATEAGLQEAIHTNGVWDASFRICRPDGKERIIHGAGIVLYDDQRRPLRMLGVNQDITPQQEQWAALAEAQAKLAQAVTENRLLALIQQSLIGIMERDAEGRITRVNDRFAELLGYPPQALLGLTVHDITDPRDWPDNDVHLRELMQHGQGYTLEKRYRRKDGGLFWGKIVVVPVRGPDTPIQGTMALMVDIDAAKQSEERLRLALAGSQIGMYDWDIGRGTVTWSAEHERLWGYQPGEFDGTYQGFACRVHPDDLKITQARLDGARNNGEPYRHDFRVIWPDGSIHWIAGRGEFEYDGNGQAVHMRGTVLDVTDRLRAEISLREQKFRLAEAQRIAKIGSWIHDLEGRIESWSAETYRLMGIEPEAFTPHEDSLLALMHPEDQPLMQNWLQQCRAGQSPAPLTLRRYWPDGSLHYLRGQGELQHDTQGRPLRLVGTVQDVTEQYLAEQQLHKSQEQLTLSLEAGQFGAWQWDLAGSRLQVTRIFRHIFGLADAPDYEYDLLIERIHPEDRPRVEADVQHAIATCGRYSHEYRLRRPDGAEHWIASFGQISLSGDKKSRLLHGVIQDITTQKLAVQNLDRLRLLMAEGERIAHFGTWEYVVATQETVWSEEECRIYGYDPAGPSPDYATMLHRSIHPEDAERLDQAFQAALQARGPFELEHRIVRPDGTVRVVQDLAYPAVDDAGQLVKYTGTTLDITARKEAEAALARSELRLRLATEGGQVGTWYWDIAHDTFELSDLCRRHLALAEGAEFSYAYFLSVLHPDDREPTDQTVQAALRDHQDYATEYRVAQANGGYRWPQAGGRGVYDHQGQPVGMIGMTLDITPRKEAETALYESRERLRLFIERAPAALAMFDPDMRYLAASQRWKDDYRLGDRDIIGLGHYELFPDLPEHLKAAHRRGLAGETLRAEEDCITWGDGRVQWTRWELLPWRQQDGAVGGLLISAEDITARKQMLKNLQDSEHRFRSLFEHLPMAYQSLDIQGRWLDANQQMAKLLGFEKPEDMLGQEFIDYWDDSLKDRFEGNYDEFKRNHTVEGELLLHRRDGQPITVQIAGRIQRDADGRFMRTHCVVIDMTERRAMEQAILALNADLEHKVEQRTAQLAIANAAKSQFLASMSHEIRTPMNGVLGVAQLLAQEPLTEDQQSMVKLINNSGKTLLGIINDILDFSKIEAGQLAIEHHPFHVRDTLESVKSLLGVNAHDKGLLLRHELPANLKGPLLGDALRIEQILLNLGSNAVKFTQRGEVVLRVIPLAMTDQAVRLRFEVKDTGIGLSPEAMEKLFQPFTQADDSITRRFGGTGLGLSISKRLVELMGGAIGVESTEGSGSTFWFELPFKRMTETTVTENAVNPPTGPSLKGLRLLVVDDSEINLVVAERALKKLGAEVTRSINGQHAVDCLTANPDGFDAVLMDIQMPVMDGLTATRLIRDELHLDQLPVIALTAGVLPEERQNAMDAGVDDFLPKPFELDLMATVISNACQSKAGLDCS